MSLLFHLSALVGLMAGLLASAEPRPPFPGEDRPDPRVWVVAAFGAFGLAAALVLGAARPHPFLGLRLLAWGVFFYLPLALILLARRLGTARLVGKLCLLASLALGMLAVWVFLIEPRWLEVSQHRLAAAGIGEPIRVVVVADLQTDRVGAHERRALRVVAEAEPDLILLTGDYLQVPLRRRGKLEEALRQAMQESGFSQAASEARLGAFAVQGDVESAGWESLFAGTAVRALVDSISLDLGPLTLTALDVAASRFSSFQIPAVDGFHIAMGHAPDFALAAPQADLLLAGHVHGGQVRLPFLGPLLTFTAVPRDWAVGRTELPSSSARPATLIVSRGVGMERGAAPRLRFLCRPEVLVIDLVPPAFEQAAR